MPSYCVVDDGDTFSVVAIEDGIEMVLVTGLDRRRARRIRNRIARAARIVTRVMVRWDGRTSTYRPIAEVAS